jgi:hypothetical protein
MQEEYIQDVIVNGGFLDRGTLTMLRLDCPDAQVVIEWQDGSRSQHTPQAALEKITMDALMGKHPQRVYLTPESLERLQKPSAG